MTILLILIGFILVAVIAIFNSIINAKNNVIESFSSIDTVLQNRSDLIPNLVEIVKKYASHEADIFTKVSETRSKLLSGSHEASEERFSQENSLHAGMKSIFAIAENYPDLKASTNYLELQNQWSEVENRLQAARRAYNAAVKELQNKKEMFPSNIVAGMMTIPVYTMFEAELAAQEKLDAKSLLNN